MNCIRIFFASFLTLTLLVSTSVAQESSQGDGSSQDELWLSYDGDTQAAGKGKKIVLIAGDDEYRSEETMPMLAKILSKHHGFECHVLFPINPKDNTIQPDFQTNIPGMHLLSDADLVILGLRFRQLPDDQMKHFVDYMNAGKPIIGTRTSTHAFRYNGGSDSKYKHFSFNAKEWPGGFGQQVLGDTWVAHHGHHKKESCRGVIVEENKSSPILNGVTDVWGPSDVYTIKRLPKSATVLLKGQVLDGMTPDSKPVDKKNNPMMPLAWTKEFKTETGNTCRIFNTTMGASNDFACEDLRRLVINACYWAVQMEDSIPEKANVEIVGVYKPTMFGFGTFAKGLKPKDYK